jgi:tetratricopeptide (TPR) repeat protein
MRATPAVKEFKSNKGAPSSSSHQTTKSEQSSIQALPVQATDYFNSGLSLYQSAACEHDYEQAFENYSKAIALDPNFSEAYYNRALVFYKLGFKFAAIEDYTMALESNPVDVEALHNRSCIYRELGFYAEALEDIRKALLFANEKREEYAELIPVCEGFSKVISEEAVAAQAKSSASSGSWLSSLVSSCTTPPAPKQLGTSAFLNKKAEGLSNEISKAKFKKQYFLCIEICTKLIAIGNDILKHSKGALAANINKNLSNTHFQRGFLYSLLQDYPAAIKAYTEALIYNSQDPAIYNNCGNCHQNLKNFESAIVAYQEALKIDSSYFFPHFNLMKIYSLEKFENYEKAIEHANKAHEIAKKDIKYVSYLGEISNNLQYLREKVAIGVLHSQAEELYKNANAACRQQRRFADAVKLFDKFIAIEQQIFEILQKLPARPDSLERAAKILSDAYYDRGLCQKILGNFERAIADYQEALKINPSYLFSHFNLMKIYSEDEFRNDVMALEHASKAKEIANGDPARYTGYLDEINNTLQSLQASSSNSSSISSSISVPQASHTTTSSSTTTMSTTTVVSNRPEVSITAAITLSSSQDVVVTPENSR